GPAQCTDPVAEGLLIQPQVATVGYAAEALRQHCPPFVDRHHQDCWRLAVLTSHADDALQGPLQAWVAELPGDAQEVRQVELADPQDVDAVDRGNLLDVL